MITAILLAAGRSERFGQDKPTFIIGGESLIQRCLRQAAGTGIGRYVIVANRDNVDLIRDQLDRVPPDGDWTLVIQDGFQAHASIRTGLDAAGPDTDEILLCCTNDLVPDDTISRLLAVDAPEQSLTLVTATLRWVFRGGMLRLDGDRVLGMVEKPDGGVQPGSSVNILLHRYRGQRTIDRMAEVLAETGDYEQTINHLCAEGLDATAVRVERWVGVKDPGDVERARETFFDSIAASA